MGPSAESASNNFLSAESASNNSSLWVLSAESLVNNSSLWILSAQSAMLIVGPSKVTTWTVHDMFYLCLCGLNGVELRNKWLAVCPPLCGHLAQV